MEEENQRDGGPLVSIVVPALNAARFIVETLESVLEQTYRNFEVIVVDDGSTDGTAAIVEEFARCDGRIRLIRQNRSGVATARNRGIFAARGDLIAPLDADDVWRADNLQKKVSALTAAPAEVALVYSWSRIIDRKGCPTGEKVIYEHEGWVYPELIRENFVANGSAALLRRDCFDRCRYDVSFCRKAAQGCEDWDLYLQVAEHYRFAVVPEFLVRYRRAPESLSSNRKAMARSYRLLLSRHAARSRHVTADHLRTSFINFHLYLANEAFRSARYWETHKWFIIALLGSRGYLMRERGTYKAIVKYALAPLWWKEELESSSQAMS